MQLLHRQLAVAQIYESIAGHKPTAQMLIVLCGVAKIFVGDLTEAGEFLSFSGQYFCSLLLGVASIVNE